MVNGEWWWEALFVRQSDPIREGAKDDDDDDGENWH